MGILITELGRHCADLVTAVGGPRQPYSGIKASRKDKGERDPRACRPKSEPRIWLGETGWGASDHAPSWPEFCVITYRSFAPGREN